MSYSKTFLKRIKDKLLKKREDIISSLDEIVSQSNETSERATLDEGDKAVAHYSLHYLSQLSYKELKIYNSIEISLKKIEGGNFGICEICGKEINPKRIEAIPWAPFCVKCQEKREKGLI